MTEMNLEEKKIRGFARSGNAETLEQELLLLSVYDVLYPNRSTSSSKIYLPQERLICSLYDKLNKVSEYNPKNFLNLFCVLSELEDIEFQGSYCDDYDIIKQRTDKLKNNLDAKVSVISDDYLSSLRSLSSQKNFSEYLILRNQTKLDLKQAERKGFDFSELSNRLEIQNNDLLKNNDFQKFIYDSDNIFKLAIEEFEKGEDLAVPVHLLNEVEANLANTDIYDNFKTSKNNIIESYVDKFCGLGFKYAQERKEKEMRDALDNAKKIMRYAGLDKTRVEPIRNSFYKENLFWSVDELKKEIEKKEPDALYVNQLEGIFRCNNMNLRRNSKDAHDLEFSAQKEKMFNTLLCIIDNPKHSYRS